MKTRLSSLNRLRSIFLSFFVAVALAGCGGGGGSSDIASDTAGSNSDQEGSIAEGEQVDGTDMESTESIGNTETDVLIGVFIDSPVEGVSYMTETQSGTTNSAGEFFYIAGENVTFSIGTLEFPTVPAATQITPVDLAQGSPSPSETITNIAVLLQSLDEDGNASNGITIPESAAASAAPVDLFADVDQFSNDAVVINLVANSGSTTTTLISAGTANEHLLDSIGFDNTADDPEEPIIPEPENFEPGTASFFIAQWQCSLDGQLFGLIFDQDGIGRWLGLGDFNWSFETDAIEISFIQERVLTIPDVEISQIVEENSAFSADFQFSGDFLPGDSIRCAGRLPL